LGGDDVQLSRLRHQRGDFSLQGWVDDLRAAIETLIHEATPTGIWLVGTNTGGSVVTCVAADDPRVRGAALLSPRADFDDWAAQPRRFLEHARDIGAIRTTELSRRPSTSGRVSCRRFRPVDAARRLRTADRCSSCTATTTTACQLSTPGSWPRPTAPQNCG
jgi:putative redox protein